MINICEIHRSDINRDGIVDIDDTIILGQAYGSRPGNDTWNPNADINQDGVVDDVDLEILHNDFGRVCPVTASPTTTVLGVFVVAAVIMYVVTKLIWR